MRAVKMIQTENRRTKPLLNAHQKQAQSQLAKVGNQMVQKWFEKGLLMKMIN